MQVDHTKNIIEISEVSFSYSSEVEILKDISLAIHQGDYLGVIGPNGGGKTTLIKVMLGLLKPTKGTIKLFGTDLKRFKDWWKIGYVPQKAAYFDTNFPSTVSEVVSMGRYPKKGFFRGLNRTDKELIEQAMENVGITHLKNRLIGRLSGGELQRTFIARALAAEPKIVFLDEPTAGVDLNAQEQFYSLLEKLNKELDLTLVLVSHDIDVVAHEATELACINQRLVYHGPPKEFIKNDYLNSLYGKNVRFILHDH
jgi:zinc transport system ATP-binding protein